MSKNSKIEWTHHTFNPWWGCVKVSPGCKHCYAETWARRLGQDVWGPTANRRVLSEAYWAQPISWNQAAAVANERHRVFCASMGDVFEDRRDLDDRRTRLWGVIRETPNLDWLLLTKRPENISRLIPWKNNWPANVWLGTTAENQRWLDKRMPHLLSQAARVLFLSCEPLLGPIDLSSWNKPIGQHPRRTVDWVIAGGESGHGARHMHPEWLTSLRDQCKSLEIQFHFKQWGNWRPVSPKQAEGHANKVIFLSTGNRITIANLGKKVAGRQLEGRTWDQLPKLRLKSI